MSAFAGNAGARGLLQQLRLPYAIQIVPARPRLPGFGTWQENAGRATSVPLVHNNVKVARKSTVVLDKDLSVRNRSAIRGKAVKLVATLVDGEGNLHEAVIYFEPEVDDSLAENRDSHSYATRHRGGF